MSPEEWAIINVKVRPSTRVRLEKQKLVPSESFDSVITRLLDKAEGKA